MQFKVPQFLDIEDKIFGPFTFSEFVYLVGGGGLCYVVLKLLGFLLGFIPALIIGGFSVALVFYKPNGKPFVDMVENSLKYYTQNKLYVWKRSESTNTQQPVESNNQATEINPHLDKLNKSKLRDLSWSLDVLDPKKNNEEKI